MTVRELAILKALSKALIPKTEVLDQSPLENGTLDRTLHHLQCLPRNLRFLFRLGLFFFDAGGLIYGGRFFRFLHPDRQETYLEIWRGSRFYLLRLLFKLLQSVLYLNYYASPDVYQRLGFKPPPTRPFQTPPAHVDRVEGDLFLKTEVCVVGSGAGGGVVAKELAEQGRDVVLLEEGAYFTGNDFGKEALEVVQKIYRSAGLQATLGAPSILLPTGCAVGGTTVINSGTCYRLPDRVLGRWQHEFGLGELTPESMQPYFERVEKQINVVAVHDEVLGSNARIFKKGLEKLGLHGEPLHRNVRDCKGSGMCCFGCPTDAKQSIQLSYIPQAIEKGAKLYSRCHVETIIPRQGHGGTVIGVYKDPLTGKPLGKIQVDAKVVVLAAGTLHTPKLLRKNHIDISNAHIGRHLTIHPALKVSGLFDEEVQGWQGVPQGFSYEGMEEECGILFEGVFTPPSMSAAHLDLPHRRHKEVMENFRYMAVFGFLVSDEGRGWIRWLPNGDPIIYYSIGRKEVWKFIKGIRFLTEIFFAAGAKTVFPGLHGLEELRSDQGTKIFDQKTFKRTALSLAAFHPLGTCRMGSDPSHSVVNHVGEMHRIKNLFIADGSVIPSPPGVNPQETIMALATRTADYIHLERLAS